MYLIVWFDRGGQEPPLETNTEYLTEHVIEMKVEENVKTAAARVVFVWTIRTSFFTVT